MNPFEAYQAFNAIRLHFTSKSYDFVKYQGKLKSLNSIAAHNKFLRSKQKYFFAQLAKHEDPIGLIVSNLVHNPKTYITELLSEDANERWVEWKRRNESLTYIFEQELMTNDNWQKILKMQSSGIPFLLDRYITGEISPETIVIIDAFGKVLDEWSHIDHPLVKQRIGPLLKYRSFVKFNKDRCKAILLRLSNSK